MATAIATSLVPVPAIYQQEGTLTMIRDLFAPAYVSVAPIASLTGNWLDNNSDHCRFLALRGVGDVIRVVFYGRDGKPAATRQVEL